MATAKKKTPAAEDRTYDWPFGKKNYILFASALIVIIVGFIALSMGDITLAPILLVIGFLALLPWAIMARGKPEPGETRVDDNQAE